MLNYVHPVVLVVDWKPLKHGLLGDVAVRSRVSQSCLLLTWQRRAAEHLQRRFCRGLHDRDIRHRGTNSLNNGAGQRRSHHTAYSSEERRHHRIPALATAKAAQRYPERIPRPLGSNCIRDWYRTTYRRYHLSNCGVCSTSPREEHVSACLFAES
jgi:hypothetical protein